MSDVVIVYDEMAIDTTPSDETIAIESEEVSEVISEGGPVVIDGAERGANTDITSMSGMTGGIEAPTFIQFNTTGGVVTAPGKLSWNAADFTLDLGLNNDVTLQVGQEVVMFAVNKSGVTVADGDVVAITGAQGNRPSFTLVSHADSIAVNVIGVATQTIANNQSGFITLVGVVHNVDTSAILEGSQLWLGENPGEFTDVEPDAQHQRVRIGWCVRQHAVVGSIYVNIGHVPEISELNDVSISSPVTGQVLTWNGTAMQWENANVPAPAVPALSDLTDVVIDTPIEGQVLTWNSISLQWENADVPAPTTPALSDLTDVVIDTPTNGQVLTWNSGTGQWENADPTGGGGGGGFWTSVGTIDLTASGISTLAIDFNEILQEGHLYRIVGFFQSSTASWNPVIRFWDTINDVAYTTGNIAYVTRFEYESNGSTIRSAGVNANAITMSMATALNSYVYIDFHMSKIGTDTFMLIGKSQSTQTSGMRSYDIYANMRQAPNIGGIVIYNGTMGDIKLNLLKKVSGT